MKFRLPPGTFPELELANEDMDNMENVAAMIVDSTIEDFERLRLNDNGLTDKRWKPLKRKAGVMLYEDRSMRESLKRESSLSDAPSRIHPLMAVGTTRGELNELMFGLLNPTREEMLAKSACTGDYLTDCAELASIISPTPSDPLRSLQRLLLNARMKKLAWMLNHNQRQSLDTSKKPNNECSSCGCSVGRSILSGRRQCTLCSSVVCPQCRVPLKVARDVPNMFTKEKKAAPKTRYEKTTVCRPCLREVDRTDSLDVAIDEIRRASPLLAAESGLAVTSASSLFSLINSDQFDRDFFFHSYQ
ncbi:hypothetical protein PF005_g9352 [Phytophthora fragariae]|uniref:FYVE-type domain-containing protein n=1 Tax=Phytophthora fragariae TaxID=53985 RepID=A0A6A3YBB0_9STRA|nr:hypothetical protein PF005_g9352 [Phytophthora fragariae]